MRIKSFCLIIVTMLVLPLFLSSTACAESKNSQVWIYNANNKLIKHYTYAKNRQKVHVINTTIGNAGGNADDASKVFPKLPQNASIKRIYKLTDYRKKSTATIYSNKDMYIDAGGIRVKVKLTNSQYKTLTEI